MDKVRHMTTVHSEEDQRPRRRSRPIAPREGTSPRRSRRRPFMFGHLSRDASQIYFASPVRAPLAGPWSLTSLFLGGLPAAPGAVD